jgi:hypothetical protein
MPRKLAIVRSVRVFAPVFLGKLSQCPGCIGKTLRGRSDSLAHGWFRVGNSSNIKIVSNRILAGEACFVPCRTSLVPAILKVSPHQPLLTAKAV